MITRGSTLTGGSAGSNRLHSSGALQTHGIWTTVIGYDPHAPVAEEEPLAPMMQPSLNSFEGYQGLLAMAKKNGATGVATNRGTCSKCGGGGHFSFQCRNPIKLNSDDAHSSSGSDSESNDAKPVERKKRERSDDEESKSKKKHKHKHKHSKKDKKDKKSKKVKKDKHKHKHSKKDKKNKREKEKEKDRSKDSP